MTKASVPKLLIYMTCVSLFVAYALDHPQNFAVLGLGPLQTKINGEPTLSPQFKSIEFEMPVEKLRTKLELVGIPHFILDAGIVANKEAQNSVTTIWHLMKTGQEIGFYSATFQIVSASKSNVDISFTAKDANATRQLVQIFDTSLVPAALMVATMRENFSSQIESRSFNMAVLNP